MDNCVKVAIGAYDSDSLAFSRLDLCGKEYQEVVGRSRTRCISALSRNLLSADRAHVGGSNAGPGGHHVAKIWD